MNAQRSYVLITPARNEEKYIEKTIQSVIAQTVLPLKWVIVDDGSVDHTAAIIKGYLAEYPFISLLSSTGDQQRNFGSKAKAVNYAYSQVKDLDFEYIGNLDADVSFDASYFANILLKLEHNQKLGLAGGVRYDPHGRNFKKTICAKTSVGGPYQLFRRGCFDQIGGYLPLRYGGVDSAAEVMARMHGWEVESFDEFSVYHHRRTGTAKGGVLKAKFKQGVIDFTHGNHPCFEFVKLVHRCRESPYVIGSLSRFTGFVWGHLCVKKRELPETVVNYLRKEQMGRVSGLFNRLLS